MIRINGTVIPTPATYQISLNDLSKAERNANGTMIIERIATKRKLEMSWAYLSQSDLSSLLQAVSGVFFAVQYPDPQDGTLKTGTFYAGDRSSGMIDYKSGIARYKDVKFNVIEQ